jgi:ribonuclease HII
MGLSRIAGVDEAGRGPLAGPVVAAAVVLPPRLRLEGLDDSKVLSARKREELLPRIQDCALAWSVQEASAARIDELNILRATLEAMRAAVAEIGAVPDGLIVDGTHGIGAGLPEMAIPYGDSLCACVAAASIVAKVTRDRIMERLTELYPGYGFERNKGYATREHLSALIRLGPCPEHRRSFGPVRQTQQGRLIEV